MLTRHRIEENSENAIVHEKNVGKLIQGKGDGGVTTRASRRALGEIPQNENTDIAKDGFKKPVAKRVLKKADEVQAQNVENQLDMSIDGDILAKSNSEYQNYFMRRAAIRSKLLLNSDVSKYVGADHFDIEDQASVSAFAGPIFTYLQDKEFLMQPLTKDFMPPNMEISPRMRYILVNWLVQVHQNFKMQPETLYLCVALMDRYLQKCGKDVSKERFQLIGVTALFIASKFEEMYPPDIGDFSYVTDNAYEKKEIMRHETIILQAIDFYLSIPLPITFLRRLSRAVDADRQMHNMAKYLLELTVQEYDLCFLPANMRAAVSVLLSRAVLMQTSDLSVAWHPAIAYLTGYNLSDLIPPLRVLAKAAYRQNSPSKFRAIYDKYRLDDYFDRVAALPQLRSDTMERLADLKFDEDGSEAVV